MENTEAAACGDIGDLDIKDVTENTKDVKKGSLFIALKGEKTSGVAYVGEAVERGCAAILSDTELCLPIPTVRCENVRAASARVFSNLNSDPTKDMKLFAVTGTNGKTTTAYMLFRILSFAYGVERCMLISGVENVIGNGRYPSAMTTPGLKELYSLFSKGREAGVRYAVMEASSHALAYDKLSALRINAGLFTSFGTDHLDYHKDRCEYLRAKLKLAELSDIFIVNGDDRELSSLPYPKYSFNGNGSFVGRLLDCKDGVSFEYGSDAPIKVDMGIRGRFNAENALAAMALAASAGVDARMAASALSDFSLPEGRFQIKELDKARRVIIDFAHTPSAMEAILSSVRELTEGRIITVFGCGGDRDRSKRPMMGAIASKLSDLVIITEDNNRSERFEDIYGDIVRDVPNGKNYFKMKNRKRAVYTALDMSDFKDSVLLLGKGHEKYSINEARSDPYSDAETVTRYIMENKSIMTSKKAAEYAGGRLTGEDSVISGYCTDSRKVKPGDMFIAFKGEFVDGHDYIRSAYENGAAVCLSEKDIEGVPCIVVDNTLNALHSIADKYFSLIRPRLCAVTGSVGKTTTKELVAAALSAAFRVAKTEGNLNSTIGLPITLLKTLPEDEYLVAEMGMSDLGEIEMMSLTARPDIAIITNIGTSHLEMLKTRENILRAKLEITAGMKDGGILLINGDDRYLSGCISSVKSGIRVVTYGMFPDLDYTAENYSFGEGARFDIRKKDGTVIKDITIPAVGMHNIYNATAAYAVAELSGASEELIREGLKSFVPSGMRQRIYEKGKVNIICDCYNASPESMKAAFSVLKSEGDKNGGKKIAVLGQMRELGAMSETMHRETGRRLYESGADILVLAGEEAYPIADGAMEAGMSPDMIVKLTDAMDPEKKAMALCGIVDEKDTVLFKASRAVMLEKVLEALEAALEK